MKYLKYLLLALLLLVIFIVAKGLLTSSISYESNVIVDKPIKEAWSVMSDESKLPEWIEGFKKTELISGSHNQVGAVSKIYIEENGKEMIMEETITKISPPEYIAMTFTMDFMDMEYEMLLKDVNGKTEIQTTSTSKGNGLMAKIMVSLMPKGMKAQEDKNLNKLKHLIEANSKNY